MLSQFMLQLTLGVKGNIFTDWVNKLAVEILEGRIHKDSAIEVDSVDGQTVLRNK